MAGSEVSEFSVKLSSAWGCFIGVKAAKRCCIRQAMLLLDRAQSVLCREADSRGKLKETGWRCPCLEEGEQL